MPDLPGRPAPVPAGKPYPAEGSLPPPAPVHSPACPVLFGAEHFAALASLPPRTGGSAVLKAAPQLVCLTEAEDPLELWDADTPEALEHIARALQSQSLP